MEGVTTKPRRRDVADIGAAEFLFRRYESVRSRANTTHRYVGQWWNIEFL
jgi:hypothetical protein